MSTKEIVLKAGHGKAYRLGSGQRVKVVNIHGQQVVDTWAINPADPAEVMSMEHTRSCLDKLGPGAGDFLYTNRRRPILRMEEDTSPGVHDTLLSACDDERYRLLGFQGDHRSCSANFHLALAELDVAVGDLPSPWNLFENVQMEADRKLSILPPVARPGDAVTLRAVMDAIVIFSACPMDVALTNGLDRMPKDVLLVLDGEASS